MKWLDGIINSMGVSLSKLQEIVKQGKANCAAVDRETWHATDYGVAKNQT